MKVDTGARNKNAGLGEKFLNFFKREKVKVDQDKKEKVAELETGTTFRSGEVKKGYHNIAVYKRRLKNKVARKARRINRLREQGINF